jgi:hypothetical protein
VAVLAVNQVQRQQHLVVLAVAVVILLLQALLELQDKEVLEVMPRVHKAVAVAVLVELVELRHQVAVETDLLHL